MKIAILGATGHIAKGLIYGFNQTAQDELHLFARSTDRLQQFLAEINCSKNAFLKKLDEFNKTGYDAIINCTGIGDPKKLKDNISSIFGLTETFDNLILSHLEKYPDTVYINISSGAAYGTDFTLPAEELTPSKFDINHLSMDDYYGIAKLNAEAKHRALAGFNIVDIRTFGYFSRFIDLKTRYLITDIISCIMNKRELVTDSGNIVRDYIHPQDLLALIKRCMEKRRINNVYDIYSRKPVAKFDVIGYFSEQYSMKYRVDDTYKPLRATGKKDNYCSNNKRAQSIGYDPQFTSMDCIMQESTAILKN